RGERKRHVRGHDADEEVDVGEVRNAAEHEPRKHDREPEVTTDVVHARTRRRREMSREVPWRRSPGPGAVHSGFTFSACGPFWPWVTSKLTRWPSDNVRRPVPLMARKWTNTSGPPSRSMKPNPFASSNHLTVP